MKFRDQLNSLKIPQWADYYVNYEKLKNTIEGHWKKKKKKDKDKKGDKKKKDKDKDKKKAPPPPIKIVIPEESSPLRVTEQKSYSATTFRSLPLREAGRTLQEIALGPSPSARRSTSAKRLKQSSASISIPIPLPMKTPRVVQVPPTPHVPDSLLSSYIENTPKKSRRKLDDIMEKSEEEEEAEDDEEQAEEKPLVSQEPQHEPYFKDVGPDEQFLTPEALKEKVAQEKTDIVHKMITYSSMGLYLPSSLSETEQKKRMQVFDDLLAEANKVNSFYLARERELSLRFEELVEDAKALAERIPKQVPGESMPKEVSDMQERFFEVFRQQQKIKSFSTLNATGFDKIIKSYDKLAGCNSRSAFNVALRQMDFLQSPVIYDLNRETIKVFAQLYHGGNTGRSEHRLRDRLRVHRESSEMKFSGMKYGFTLAVAMGVMWHLVSMGENLLGVVGAYELGVQPIYQGCFVLVCLLWLSGISLQVWHDFQINHIYVFEFNPAKYLSPAEVFEIAINMSLVYCLSLLCFLSHSNLDFLPLPLQFSQTVHPGALLLALLIKVLSPWGPLASSNRLVFQSVAYFLTSPFGRVRFRDIFIGEYMTSLNKMCLDILYATCLFIYGVCLQLTRIWQPVTYTTVPYFERVAVPIVLSIPLVSRMLQCSAQVAEGRNWSHVINMLKYMMAVGLLVIGALHPLFSIPSDLGSQKRLFTRVKNAPAAVPPSNPYMSAMMHHHWHEVWCGLAICLTIFSAVWDCKMDWGLLRPKHKFLRPHIMLYRPWLYYSMMALNFPLRFVWCLSFTPFDWRSWEQTYILPLVLILELCRRTIWGILTVENMHVKDFEGTTTGKDKRGGLPLFFEESEHREKKEFPVWNDVVILLFAMVVMIATDKISPVLTS